MATMSIPYMERLPEIYQKALRNMLVKLEAEMEVKNKRMIIDEFGNKFTLLPEILLYRLRYCLNISFLIQF